MTGLHGLHIIGRIIVNSYLLGPGTKLWRRIPTLHQSGFEKRRL